MAANAIYLSNDKTVHDFAISNCWRTPQHWIIRIHFITGKDWLQNAYMVMEKIIIIINLKNANDPWPLMSNLDWITEFRESQALGRLNGHSALMSNSGTNL